MTRRRACIAGVSFRCPRDSGSCRRDKPRFFGESRLWENECGLRGQERLLLGQSLQCVASRELKMEAEIS